VFLRFDFLEDERLQRRVLELVWSAGSFTTCDRGVCVFYSCGDGADIQSS
jgi:hypothetical protein